MVACTRMWQTGPGGGGWRALVDLDVGMGMGAGVGVGVDEVVNLDWLVRENDDGGWRPRQGSRRQVYRNPTQARLDVRWRNCLHACWARWSVWELLGCMVEGSGEKCTNGSKAPRHHDRDDVSPIDPIRQGPSRAAASGHDDEGAGRDSAHPMAPWQRPRRRDGRRPATDGCTAPVLSPHSFISLPRP